MDKKDRKTLRRLARERDVQDMREGRRNRAATFVDRKKQASKDACRRKEQEA